MNEDTALDDITGMFWSPWSLQAPAIAGTAEAPVIYTQDKEGVPDVEKPFARMQIRHTGSRQASFADHTSKARYRRQGVFMLQCFGPLINGKGLTISKNLARLVRDSFEGKASPGGVLFRNCRVSEVGITSGWYQVNVVVEFEYDEVK